MGRQGLHPCHLDLFQIVERPHPPALRRDIETGTRGIDPGLTLATPLPCPLVPGGRLRHFSGAILAGPRKILEVERDILGREHRVGLDLVGVALPHHRHLAGIQRGHVDIAGEEGGHAHFRQAERGVEHDFIDLGRPRTLVVGVLGEGDGVVGLHPLLDHPRTRRDDGIDVGRPFFAELVELMLGHRVPERDDARQVGLGRSSGDFERLVVDGLEAEGRNVGLAGRHVVPVLDAAGKAPVPGKIIAGGGGMLQREDEVLSGQRFAVAPVELGPNLERPGQAIGRLRPALRRDRGKVEVLVEGGQADLDHVRASGAGINGLHVIHVGGRGGLSGDSHGLGQRRHGQTCRQRYRSCQFQQ